jgi:2-desacetyl-2-hydroxyethyl bacteriochlorophyllide A dehydrogenase
VQGQRLVFTGPRAARLEPFEVPAPGRNQVVVRTTRTLVSAGTELKAYLGLERGATTRPYPIHPGYSHVGVIEAIGSGVTGVRPGDRVATQRGHASHVVVTLEAPAPPASAALAGGESARGPDWLAVLPGDLTDEQATFAVLGSVALHGLRKAGLRLDESCVVTGQGVVGQLVMQLARRSGARPVVAVDMDGGRLAVSQATGASAIVDVSREDVVARVQALTGGRGADVAFDCTATTGAFPHLLKLAAMEGRIVIVGSLVGTATISLYEELQLKELTVMGAYQPLAPRLAHPAMPWTQAANRQTILELIAAGQLAVDQLISHTVPARAAPELFAQMGEGPAGWLGVVFEW